MKLEHLLPTIVGFCCGAGLGATTACFPSCVGDLQLTSGTYAITKVHPPSEESADTSEPWMNLPLAEGGTAVYTDFEELRIMYTPPSGVETTVVFQRW